MPFRSEKQRRFMWSQHPEIARRWTKKYGSKIQRAKKASTGSSPSMEGIRRAAGGK